MNDWLEGYEVVRAVTKGTQMCPTVIVDNRQDFLRMLKLHQSVAVYQNRNIYVSFSTLHNLRIIYTER
jgi:hypothetical protein